MKSLFTLILSLSLTVILSAQSSKSKECTSQLQIDPVLEEVEKTHYIFTGSDTTGLNVKVTKIKVMEARLEMVKRRDKNCTSPNIEDCYISVMEEIPPVTMNLYTLPSPDQTEEYEIRKEKVKVEKRAGGQIETPIVCEKNRSKSLINKLQTALIAQGYPLSINGTYDKATQLSVTDFQREKGLAYGDLSLETLAALGIK
jgi:hypothetical protein